MIYMPEVGGFCEVLCGDHTDYDWVKIHVVHIHNGVVIGVVDMPGERIHDDIEKYSPGYNRAVFREIAIEEAIAAQPPVWNGEGFPPVGVKCEWFDRNTKEWLPVEVVYSSEWVLVVSGVASNGDVVELAIERYGDEDRCKFRPIRTEEERRRGLAVGSMERIWESVTGMPACEFETIYDDIAAGKIPGVRLADD